MFDHQLYYILFKNIKYVKKREMEKMQPLVETFYTCSQETGKCDFKPAKKEVYENVDIKILKREDEILIRRFVDVLDAKQKDFLVDKIDGFDVLNNGYVHLRLTREKAGGENKNAEARVGVIRSDEILDITRQKSREDALDKIVNRMSKFFLYYTIFK